MSFLARVARPVARPMQGKKFMDFGVRKSFTTCFFFS
jgi:hypothetical protein